MLDRGKIISALGDELIKCPFIDAMWEEGAAAFDRVDEWSDLNVHLSMSNADSEVIFKEIEKCLNQSSWIIDKYMVPEPDRNGHYQAFYRINGLNKFQVINCTIINRYYPKKYPQPEIHGNYIIHFDKEGIFKQDNYISNDFIEDILDQRIWEIEQRFVFFQYLVEKEINRYNYIEAFELYYGFTIEPLIELLRIKYAPFHYNFKSRYIYYDLPKEVVEQIEPLVFIRNISSFQKIRLVAQMFFYDTLESLKITRVNHLNH